MKRYIFLNLKRFDISKNKAGINSIAPIHTWAEHIVTSLEKGLEQFNPGDIDWEFPVFLPEAHLLPASQSHISSAPYPLSIGCQAVHHADTDVGKNFGAFTTSLPANAAVELGCSWTIIGHSEQRAKLLYLFQKANISYDRTQEAIHLILNEEIKMAHKAGLQVLYCIGEHDFEVSSKKEVLEKQIQEGLFGVDTTKLVLAYEPIWAIGPGKTPPTALQIEETTVLVKQLCNAPLVYGGGMKQENAEGIGAISPLDGGLVALTRFTGDIGFYPEEYLKIVASYAKGVQR
jgi:triosephosphate isomerase